MSNTITTDVHVEFDEKSGEWTVTCLDSSVSNPYLKHALSDLSKLVGDAVGVSLNMVITPVSHNKIADVRRFKAQGK